jgi:RNA-directed DNA polymerase
MMKYYELLDRGEVPYREARIRSKNGKIRDIIVPHEEIKIELKSLNTSFQNIFDGRNIGFQVAYKKGKNVLSNAIIHKDNPYIFKLDLKDFFPSCNKELLSQKIEFLFSSSYNYRIVMDEFFKTTLHKDALFIGSPISGTLANYCMANAAGMIRGIAAKNNVGFSIYADDMTFSSERFISEDYVNGIINYVFEELGLENTFKLNTKKSTGQSKNRRHITGVSFNDNNEPTSARAISRFIRTGIYRVEKGGCVDKQVLKGKIQYALSIEGLSGKVATILKKYEKTVLKEKFLSKTQEETIFAK